MPAAASPARAVSAGLAVIVALVACGPQPPAASALLDQSSRHMEQLKGFQFQMQITGFLGGNEPVQSAQGEAHPPDLHARVNLKEGSVLLEVEVILAAGNVYLKSFTGGWQQLSEAQLAAFFDARPLFDPRSGLFAAMRETSGLSRGNPQKVAGHDTYPIEGRLSAARVHQLLALIRDQGTYRATYWIESPGGNLWRARLDGKLFDPSKEATITFDFSNHDHPVSVTAPPLG